MMRWFRRTAPTFGDEGEAHAARHLEGLGLRIVARNVRLGRHEIDLIARDGDETVFVEVKTRRSDDAVDPIASIGVQKRRHIRQAARRYIAQHRLEGTYCRFDVVAVVAGPPGAPPKIDHYPNAFPG